MLCFREMRLLALLSIILLAGVLARWWFWLGPGKAEIIWASPISSSSEAPGEEGAASDSNTQLDTSGEDTASAGASAPALPYENAISTVESAYVADESSAPGAAQSPDSTAQSPDIAPQTPAASVLTSPMCAAAPGLPARIELNTATIEQLLTLPGIGPVLAQAILDERVRRGRFTVIADLLNVKGIGQARLEKLTPLVCVVNP